MNTANAVKSPGAGTPGPTTSSPTHNHVGTSSQPSTEGKVMSSAIVPSALPFDAIRKMKDDGREYWSARDLGPLLGYAAWERVPNVIERVCVSINNTGQDATDHIRGASKMITTGKGAEREVSDYHMSRFACYLFAMNGDPRKDAIAQAQSYFAIQTRIAEKVEKGTHLVRTPQPERPLLPQSYAEALRELASTVEAKQRAEEVAESKQRALDVHEGATGSHSVRDTVKILAQDHGIHIKEMALRTRLREWRWTFRSKGYDQPYATHSTGSGTGRLCLKPQTRKKDGRRVVAAPQLRVTQKGITDLARILGAGTQQVAIIEGGVA